MSAFLCYIYVIFVGNSAADWLDENNNMIVCELFADEYNNGNRTSTHLNKAGFRNVVKRFE